MILKSGKYVSISTYYERFAILDSKSWRLLFIGSLEDVNIIFQDIEYR